MGNHSLPLGHTTSVLGSVKNRCRGNCVGGIFMGNQLRPHARNMLIGIQAKAVTASHTVFTHTHSLPLPRRPVRVSSTTEMNLSTTLSTANPQVHQHWTIKPESFFTHIFRRLLSPQPLSSFVSCLFPLHCCDSLC